MVSRFRPTSHVPRYSRLLFDVLRSPVVIYLFLAGNTILLSGSLGFFYFEEGINPNVHGFTDALWWGLATVTTVGFGDIVPVTEPGRLIAFGLIATGVILFVGSSAIISSAFFARIREEIIGLESETMAEWEQVLTEITALRQELKQLRRERSPTEAQSGYPR